MGWDIVQDAINSLMEAINNMLTDGIMAALQATFDTLSNTFNPDNAGLMTSLLSDSPAEFTGSTSSSATPIWSGIETITNQAVVPIAIFILMIVLTYELIQMVVSGNNFRDFDTAIFFKWTIKSVCGILLVSNVFYISTAIFGFGTSAVTAGLGALFPDDGSFFGDKVTMGDDLRNSLLELAIGWKLIILILAFIILIVTFIVLGAIIIVLASRMIEIFMYLSISPIPMATMMNNDWGQIGKNWLRNILALAFQGFFIVIALTIFKVMLTNVVSQMSSMGGDGPAVIGSMALLLGYVVALIFTIFRSSNISKSVFAAQ